jgi:hypothetical protein
LVRRALIAVRVLAAVGAVLVLGGPSAAGAPQALRVGLQPAILRLGHHAVIFVSDPRSRAIQVRLAGGTYPDGTLLPWRSLRLAGGIGRGSLPIPALRGVYPVLIRHGPGSPAFRVTYLRVFEPGTLARPAFPDPVDVVRWWVHTRHGTLVAIKAWPRPVFDRRDSSLHRLYVVAYSPPGRPGVRDRLGMFVTAFREAYGAPWRLLEATAEP